MNSDDDVRQKTGSTHGMLEETRICNECPAQFTNKYSMFEQTLEDVPA